MMQTGFWKTNQIVILGLGLFHFISPATSLLIYIHITHSQCHYQALPTGLLFWNNCEFCQPCKFTIEIVGPMHGGCQLHGRHGSDIHPSDGETFLGPLNIFGLWLAFFILDLHYSWSKQSYIAEDITHLRLPTPPTPLPLGPAQAYYASIILNIIGLRKHQA